MPKPTDTSNRPTFGNGQLRPPFLNVAGEPIKPNRHGVLGEAGRAAVQTQDTDDTVGRSQTQGTPGAFVESFLESEDEGPQARGPLPVQRDELDDSTDEEAPIPDLRAKPLPKSSLAPAGAEPKKKKKRVTLPPSVAESQEESERVEYPDLEEYTLGRRFSSTRRLSAVQISDVKTDLELVHAYYEEEGRMVEHLVLYRAREDGSLNEDNIITTASTTAQLAESVKEYQENWRSVISKYTSLREAHGDDLETAEALLASAESANLSAQEAKAETDQKIRGAEDKIATLTAQLDTFKKKQEEKYERARVTLSRLRAERQQARQAWADAEDNVQILTTQNEELQAEVNDLKRQAKKLFKSKAQKKRRSRDDFDPSSSSFDSEDQQSDDEHRRDRNGDRSSRRGNRDNEDNRSTARSSRKGTPITEITDIDRQGENDPRYPNIADFYGKEGEDLEQWQASAETKFRRSYKSFPDEWTMIEYL